MFHDTVSIIFNRYNIDNISYFDLVILWMIILVLVRADVKIQQMILFAIIAKLACVKWEWRDKEVSALPSRGCKDICFRYKASKPANGSRYAMGQRRCQICELFIQWEGLWCPCCGVRLRTRPRVGTLREKMRKKL